MSGVEKRGREKNRAAASFAEEQRKAAAWSNGHPIPNFDPAAWRYDDAHRPLRFSDFQNQASEFGWDIDVIRPLALGGADNLTNLRPLRCGSDKRR